MTAKQESSFVRRAAPVVAVAAVGGVLWGTLHKSGANSLRLVVVAPSHAQTGATQRGIGVTTTPSPPGQTAAPSTTGTVASTVCAHPTQVTGPVIETLWGPVQVHAELGSANHVCSGDAIQYPNERQRSLMINSQAVPWINGEVKTQGVNFDAIGGATYTTDGYRSSLQAILDGRST